MQEWVYTCELCGGTLREQHGQLVCPNCGRCLDCCDLSSLPADAPPSALASPPALPAPAPREEGDARMPPARKPRK
ncbi:MAG: hypothetical protein WCI75_14865 [candidate division NC10 bacterium]